MATSESGLSLLTWNIYGLHPGELQERTSAVCDYVLKHSPSVVFFQEVVQQTWPTITSHLGSQYHCYCGRPRAHYFHALLIRNDSDIKCPTDENVINFPTSTQGRYIIEVSTSLVLPPPLHSVKIHFLTSHIESMDEGHNVAERKSQLKVAFNRMEELNKMGTISIFGGDMNTYDSEILEIGLPPSVTDIWEYCGAEKGKKQTWNTNVPVFRPDRVYLGPKDGPLIPVKFCLVGREKLSKYNCYPSDHLGIWIDFKLKS